MDGSRPPTEDNQHVALDIINTAWLESVEDRARESLHRKPPTYPTIFRVPPRLRRGNRHAYEPKLVSIGPYHHGKSKDLKAMEELKWRLLHHYLSMVPNGSNNEGIRKMKSLEKKARDCYSEVIDMGSDQFVEMLLLDGCFLAQIFNWRLQAEELRLHQENDAWFRGVILRDLLLLENQLPYFIVKHLLDTLGVPGWNSSLQQTAIKVFEESFLPLFWSVPQELPIQEDMDVDHLLHLIHKRISSMPFPGRVSNRISCNKRLFKQLYSALSPIMNKIRDCLSNALPRRNVSLFREKYPRPLPTVTELVEAGVKIEVRQTINFLDISFCKDQGVLEIPVIMVHDYVDFFFANLIALEQSCTRHPMYVTDYIRFMDDIINTSRDVELLHQEGIIVRYLGDDRIIASLFNKLGKCVIFYPHGSYLRSMYKDLNAYCQSRWPRWRAKAVHDYFSNPWTIISLGAAVLLLGLTIIQTVYSALDYNKK